MEEMETTIPMGHLLGESEFDFLVRKLLRYQELNGEMLAASRFTIHWNCDYPEEFWGANLGSKIAEIRKDRKEYLISLGFDYEQQTEE